MLKDMLSMVFDFVKPVNPKRKKVELILAKIIMRLN
jgi:hypothetical protein